MSDRDLAELAEASSRLLLQAPDERVLAALAPMADAKLDLAQARQDFYDFLCIAQSGCFVPPYAHVLGRAEETLEFWHFPPARFDGGDALLPWYDAVGFNPAELQCDPFIAMPNRPLDHVGVLLAFLALLLDASKDTDQDQLVLVDFVSEHIQPWANLFVGLLRQAPSAYINLLGEALADLFDDLCARYPPHALPDRTIAEPMHGNPVCPEASCCTLRTP